MNLAYPAKSGKYINIEWEYGTPNREEILNRVRALPDRQFISTKSSKYWKIPATAFAAKALINSLEGLLPISSEVYEIAEQGNSPSLIEIVNDERAYPYQLYAANWLAARKAALLADDTGLGKTIEVLLALNTTPGRGLFVVPAIVSYKWEREIETWSTIYDNPTVIESGKQPIPKEAGAVIISYALMAKRWRELNGKFDHLIFDEAHYLKSSKAKRTTNGLILAQNPAVSRLYLMSATPFLNRPIEIWSLLNFIAPKEFGSYFSFGVRYANGYDGGYGMIYDGLSNSEELRSRLEPYMLRRTKREVLKELPPVTVEVLPIRSTYRFIPRQGETAIQKIGREYVEIGAVKANYAVEWAEDFFEEGGTQLAVFAYHLEVVGTIEEALKGKFKIGTITGSTSQKDRDAVVTQFQSGQLDIIIFNTAGSEGIDLYAANHLLMAERVWSPAAEYQAIGRLDRNGQTLPVTVHILELLDTIDSYMVQLLGNKEDQFETVLDADQIKKHIAEAKYGIH